MKDISPYHLMAIVLFGFTLSLAYGAISAALIFLFEGAAPYTAFLSSYISSFRTVISFGIWIGTAMVMFKSQHLVPAEVEAAFSQKDLKRTNYFSYKKKFSSVQRSMIWSAEFLIGSFILFTYCGFPLSGLGEKLLLIAACTEYILGAYTGRKLCYCGLMLHALRKVRIRKNLFKTHELDEINPYVNILSTLTIVGVYVHVRNYYGAPFAFNHMIGDHIEVLLITPAIIATPVLLIFNFYPRMVLRKIYSKSIDIETKRLKRKLRNRELSSFERMSYILEFNKMSRDELRYRLRLTLSDLPIGLTIALMVLQPLLGG